MDYPQGYLPCRSDGHGWKPKELVIVGRDTLERHLWCAGHEGWRIDRVDRTTGEVVHRRYVGPKDYYVRGAGQRIPSGVFRRTLVALEWDHAKVEGS